MRLLLTRLLCPLWLAIAFAGGLHAHEVQQTSVAKAQKEHNIEKVVAALVVVLQVDAPAADWALPAGPSFGWAAILQNNAPQPLRANGQVHAQGFGHRYYATAIALRAP